MVLSRYWAPPVGRPSRCDCGVDWHADASFTMKVYAHSQNDALKDAVSVRGAVVTSS